MNPEDQLIERELNQMVEQLVLELGSRPATILRMRYGFDGEPMSYIAIGHQLDLSNERVRQIAHKAERKLSRMRQLERLATATDRALPVMDRRRAELDRQAREAEEAKRIDNERRAMYQARRQTEQIHAAARAWWRGFCESNRPHKTCGPRLSGMA